MRGEAGAQALARLAPELLLLVERRAAGDRKARQDRLSRQRPIGAAHRDLDAGLGRLGEIGEQFGHFRARLEPMLGRQAPALGGRDHRAFGDAEQRVMRLVVRGVGEIGLVGRDQGQAETVGERDELRLDRALAVEPVALDLDIEPRAEDLGEALEPAFGEVAKSRPQRPVDRPGGAAGQRDEAFARPRARRREDARRRRPWDRARAPRRGASDCRSRPRSAPGARSARAHCPARRRARRQGAASPKSTVICAPMIGCTPLLASFSENSSAPNRLLVSVIASAGMASALASLASVSTSARPRAANRRCARADARSRRLWTDESMALKSQELPGRVRLRVVARAGARVETGRGMGCG